VGLCRSPRSFGLLLGLGATTSPRTWPLVFSMVVFIPLLVDSQKVQRSIVACAGILLSIWIVLLPLHMSPFGFLVYVRGPARMTPRTFPR
jgi:predicted branched-subunit amino acid permease